MVMFDSKQQKLQSKYFGVIIIIHLEYLAYLASDCGINNGKLTQAE